MPAPPGTLFVPGVGADDGNEHEDEHAIVKTTAESGALYPGDPVPAEVVDADEESRKAQDEVDREAAQKMEEKINERDRKVPEAEIVDEKQLCGM